MTEALIDRLQRFYQVFDSTLLGTLDQIYDPSVVFEDPLHRVDGLVELRRYFAGLAHGLDECRFEFRQVMQTAASEAGEPGQAVLVWTMSYRHPRLAGGRLLSLPGASHLSFGERVTYHRDYFDAGAMLYEHLPVLGFAIRRLKKRLG